MDSPLPHFVLFTSYRFYHISVQHLLFCNYYFVNFLFVLIKYCCFYLFFLLLQLRDPPAEGFFLHGVYLWGCSWDKTSGEMLDSPPKHGPIPLPVIHVTFTTETQKYGTGSEVAK